MSGQSNNGAGPLRQILEQAASESGYSMAELTVLSGVRDPYRLDAAAGHRDGQWFADQVVRFVGTYGAIHLRGLHYRIAAAADVELPNATPYVNSDQCWEWLSERAAKAGRWLGYVPFERIVDERNAPAELFIPEAHTDPYPLFSGGYSIDVPEAIEAALPSLFTGPWPERQPYRIILLGEKTSLRDILLPLAEQVGGELLLPTGEASDSMIAALAARAQEDGRPAAVLYFSDFDPSGHQMAVSVSRKLQGLHSLLYPGLDIRVQPVALTLDQVRELELPSTPLKETERRADRWRAVMGRQQTEIDALIALDPGALREIAEQAVAPFFDFSLARRVQQAHTLWQSETNQRLERHPAYRQAVIEIDAALENVRQATAAFHAVQETARETLAAAVEPPPIVVPEALITAQVPEPLFNARNNYADATRRLIHHKGLDI
jgi:hypothetical protein